MSKSMPCVTQRLVLRRREGLVWHNPRCLRRRAH